MDQQTEHIWLLMARKLSGEATAAELKELEQLLSNHPREHYSMEIMNDLWSNKAIADAQHAEKSYKELVLRMQKMGIDEEKFSEEDHFIINNTTEQAALKRKKLPYIVTGSLFVLSAALIFFYLHLQANKAELKETLANNEISTKYGSKSNLVLPDGTKVFLNSGSKLTFDKHYGLNEREVNLVGEGYFDVVKNPQKPFIIHTSNINIRVLGTAFNVKCYPDEKNTETSLIRGSLEVTLKSGNEKIILKPNEKLIVSNTGSKLLNGNMISAKTKTEEPKNIIELSRVSRLPEDSSVIETSWVNNRLIFRSETFEDVAHKLERWFGINIQFAEESLKHRRFTGIFEKETLSQALSALQLTTAFNYTITQDNVLILK
jgi:transmembrane sensor